MREDLGDPAISKLKGQLKMQAGPLGQIYLERMGGGQRRQRACLSAVRQHRPGAAHQASVPGIPGPRNANGGAEVPVDMQSNLLEVAAEGAIHRNTRPKNAALGLNESGQAPLSQSR